MNNFFANRGINRSRQTAAAMRRRLWVCVWVWLVTAVSLQAQSPITATVDQTTAATGDTVTLTITVTEGDASRPELPVLDGFQVVGSSSASQISIINGTISSQATYQYRLQPTRTGELRIPPVSIILDGQTYSTQPITIQVTQGAAPPAGSSTTGSDLPPAAAPGELAGQDLFVEAEVDNPTPYLGEQVVYTFRLYQAVNLFGQPQYDAPDFAGFWSRQETQQGQSTTTAANRTYQVTELQTVLFPTVLGEQTIEPAQLVIPGTLLRSGTSLQTSPVTVTVQPLPEGAPDDFSGAVGSFTLAAEVDVTETAVNEPVTLRLTLSGSGNLDTLPDPELPQVEGWRTFDSTATVNTQVENGRLRGSRVYEQLLVPTAPGTVEIPAIAYTFFDPDTGQYKTIRTDPIPVVVQPGAAAAPIAAVPGPTQTEVTALDNDIRHLKPVPDALAEAAPPLTARPMYWLLWLLPVLVIGADVGWQWRQQHRVHNADRMRRSQAQKQARKRLAAARKQQADGHVAAAQVLTGYLNDKLNLPVTGLTQQALAAALQEKGVDDQLAAAVKTLLQHSEMGRYAPTGMNGDQPDRLLDETETLIAQLEKVLR